MLQLVQLQVGGYDQRLAAAVSAVNDRKHLLHRVLGAALRAQVVYNQEVIITQIVQKCRPFLSKRPGQAGENAGKVGHEYRHILVEQGVCNTPGCERFARPHIPKQQQPDVPLERLRPMIDIGAYLFHNRILAVIMGEDVLVEVAVLEAPGLSPPDTLHALVAFLGFSAAAFPLLLARAGAAGSDIAAKWGAYSSLPGRVALPTINKSISWGYVFKMVPIERAGL